jgi:hypothetical protein
MIFFYFYNAGTFSISLGRGGVSDALKTLMTYDEITAAGYLRPSTMHYAFEPYDPARLDLPFDVYHTVGMGHHTRPLHRHD